MKASVEILIVEDSPTQAEQLKYILEHHNCSVSVANNGKEALAFLSKHKPTIVISDIVMPEMDGYQLCKQIKAESNLKDIPVILLTALSDPHDIVKGLECGADSFIVKPYEENYLFSRVQYILANSHINSREKVKMGLEIFFAGKKYFINSDRLQILNLLISTFETAVQKNLELKKVLNELKTLNEQLEQKVAERTASLTTEVAERKWAEEEIRRSERKFKDLTETTTDWVWEVDSQGVYTYASPKVKDILGYEPAEILGKTPFELMPEEEAEKILNFFKVKVINKELFYGLENVNRHKDGHLVVLETNGIPILDEKGELKGYRGIDRDITERKRAEEAIERLRRHNEMILQSAGDGIFGLDLEGRVTFVNLAATKMLGYEMEELTGKIHHNVVHHSKPDRTPYTPEKCPIYAAYREGIVYKGEDEVFWRKDGTSFPVEYTSTPIREADKLVGAVVTFRDITLRKQAEVALRKNEENFRALFETSRDAIMITDHEGFLDCNKATLAMFGCSSKDQFVAKHPSDLSPPKQQDGRDSLAAAEEHINAAYDKGVQFFEWTHRRMDGTPFPAEVLLSRFEVHGKTALQAVVRDITERKKAEDEIKNRVKELERFYDMAVGRELKMTELKEEIKELENELKRYKDFERPPL